MQEFVSLLFLAFSFMTSYALKMPLLLVREIRNLVREKSVKMLLPTVPRRYRSSVMVHIYSSYIY